MKVANPTVCQAQRLLRAARRLYNGERIDSRWLRRTFGVSPQTAMRDLHHLRLWLPAWCEGRGVRDRPRHLTIRRRSE